ncbi:Phosphoribosylaminoimidazole-succinocarboxamide synthase [Pseudobythopirellula maris]|uniref:Phosphoribosylaminoimidazole-succinocarboxamide synthase n=1 Tax=Pseudobythopirellula maris TaxID=2527991 RepID=A0A5C5ZJB5_9BACT|nr:phosphoribosylaminoimidazolesuccinocarboxamide synthase [Pseudobythopirellula maris]TWT87464.1 Phosphoribosylaminoimidazole-succinocarboxamide synthase [Pseudobythopirellula maris]
MHGSTHLPDAPDYGLDGLPVRRGKVREVYDLGDRVLLVASDRISAFDWVLPTVVPDKGRVLTQISVFWFQLLADRLGIAHHLLETEVERMGLPASADLAALAGRTMLCRKTSVVPFECVVRGYLSGSGWKEYQKDQAVCGVALPPGLVESDRLPEPIFTPATKAELGDHDENVSYERMANDLGAGLAEQLRRLSLEVYQTGADAALDKGMILADTKFEFGLLEGSTDPILIDEALTPDSSRYWPADRHKPGGPQPSFDKQYVRDWLLASDWDRTSEPPALPADVVARTRAKYVEAFEALTGAGFGWG